MVKTFGLEQPIRLTRSSSDEHGKAALGVGVLEQKGLGDLVFILSGMAIDEGNVVLVALSL
jgi:hypothetical protein